MKIDQTYIVVALEMRLDAVFCPPLAKLAVILNSSQTQGAHPRIFAGNVSTVVTLSLKRTAAPLSDGVS